MRRFELATPPHEAWSLANCYSSRSKDLLREPKTRGPKKRGVSKGMLVGP